MTSRIPDTAVSENGVLLITPSDKDFKTELSSLLKDRDSRAAMVIQSALPFCVFVKNTNTEEIVGISLQWKILRADGSSVTNGTSFFSLDSETKMLVDAMTKSFGSNLTEVQNQEIESHISQLRRMRNELIKPGDTIVVSIDGLILSDGTFLGPDNNRLIVNIKALVQASQDLGEAIYRQTKKHEDPNKIFGTVEELAKDPSGLRKFGPQETQFQRAYLTT